VTTIIAAQANFRNMAAPLNELRGFMLAQSQHLASRKLLCLVYHCNKNPIKGFGHRSHASNGGANVVATAATIAASAAVRRAATFGSLCIFE
jgi:hypothetical protein